MEKIWACKRENKIKVIYNGRIYLTKGAFCEALIVDRGRIVKTGSSKEILEEVPSASEKIDAEGALVLPAFYDSHLHLKWAGIRSGGIEGSGARSIDEVIRRGREYIEKHKPPFGSYVHGNGINPDLFSEGEKRDLSRQDVDKISIDHPVILSRHCGHTIYSNSSALKLAGLSERALDPEGGTIEKDPGGRPTGVLRESAANLLRDAMPHPSKEEIKTALSVAMKKAHSLGISACGSYDTGGPDFDDVLEVYREIYDESLKLNKPALRVTMQCGISVKEEMLDAHIKRGIYLAPLWETPLWGSFLKMGSIKLFEDGTLGGQTAWMRRPYRDKPGTKGFPVLDETLLKGFVKKASSNGMQVLVHAIGDAGIDVVLKAFENVTAPGKNPLRHGIIHFQIGGKDLFERAARNNILALVQPIFLGDDLSILESRVGPDLASNSYAWASMRRHGIPVSYSSDAPVSCMDPLLNIEWAVLRRDSEDPLSKTFCPGEREDIFTAVDSYTKDAAYANFDETSLGRIAPGFFADLVFLDRDIFTIPPEDIHKTKVLRTMCAGEIVYNT